MSAISAPYLSPEDRDTTLRDLTQSLQGELIEYGRSRQGRTLLAARIPALQPSAPAVLCAANIHGIEYIGGLVALGLLRRLQALEALRQQAEVWVVPCINPDGYARTWAQAGVGRVRDMRTNAEGVDLNRNFPLPFGSKPSWLPVAGSARRGSTFFRGEHALSEPEAKHLDQLFARARFRASINLHSFMGTFIPARVLDARDRTGYAALCDAFASEQRHRRYRRLSSRTFDTFTGEQEDHQHHVYGTWAVCTEIFPISDSFRQHLRAPSAFWRFNPRQPEAWIENDVPGIVSFFQKALEFGPPPSVNAHLPTLAASLPGPGPAQPSHPLAPVDGARVK